MLGVKIRKTAFWGRTKDTAATKVAAYFYTTGVLPENKKKKKGTTKMVQLNEQAKAYMLKYNKKHIVLNIEEITS